MNTLKLNGKKHIIVNFKELNKLNSISIKSGYNRSLDESYISSIENIKSSKFILSELLIHHHKNGVLIEPHIRYLIHQIEGHKVINNFIFDLPSIEIKDLLK